MRDLEGGKRIGVLTSGGDAQGMNAAVRAVVRAALHAGAEVFAVREGWQGAVEGGDRIVPMCWADVSSILAKGGTVIGTARSEAFRTREGMADAVANLVERGIDALVVIGGDGSLTGARGLCEAWPELVEELAAAGRITPAAARAHPRLVVAGLVGSIDNDMVGTDMTIGADSALHRITEAIDAIASTAASHQRTFVVEVMGRNCGFLALMGAIAGGADYVLVPERPPAPGWEDQMCAMLSGGRAAGRRESIVLVAEGAAERDGRPITAERVRQAIEARLGEDPKVTILGHVQRGGAPSAYDRWSATALAVAAVDHVLEAAPDAEPVVLAMRRNRVVAIPLAASVEATRKVAADIASGDYDAAVAARGGDFAEMLEIYLRLTGARPTAAPAKRDRRIAVMHAGALAPGMNQIFRDATRLGLELGYQMIGVRSGVPGLAAGALEELSWADVEGLASAGGADLGTRRATPSPAELYPMAKHLEEAGVDALLLSGGFHAYATAHVMRAERSRFPAFDMPVAVLPASIDNNLPSWRMSVGSDTALNTVVSSIDQLRLAAAASKRAFVVETMGRGCGFLAFMGGLAGGAEVIYLPETGMGLDQLSADIAECVESFRSGRVFYLAVRGEGASQNYTTPVVASLFEEEGRGAFSVRTCVLGHVQQGGAPSPYDRITAARLSYRGVAHLDEQLRNGGREYAFACDTDDVWMRPLRDLEVEMDWDAQRPVEQWWMRLRPALDRIGRRPD